MPGRPRIHANASARAAASTAASLARGIKRRALLLTPEAQEALQRLRERGKWPTDSAAVCDALIRADKRIENIRIMLCDDPELIALDRDGEGGQFSLREFAETLHQFISERL